MTHSDQHVLKTEADDDKLGQVANVVRSVSKRTIADVKSQGTFTSHFLSKLGIVRAFAKRVLPTQLKRTTFDPLSTCTKASSYESLLLHA